MPEMRYFYAEKSLSLVSFTSDQALEITEEQAVALENIGAAKMAAGSSGRGDLGPICLLVRGPGNGWIETVEGNCPHCGCMAKLHIKTHRGEPPLTLENYDWGTQCTGCGCRVDIPHGKVESILGEVS